MSKILVAMSGGVDSSVALKLLLDEGHELCGVTFVTDDSEESKAAARDAKSTAEKFGIPHHVINIADEFRSAVKDYFVRTYEEGATPNPCVICNREIKFGLLLRYARELGYTDIATGKNHGMTAVFVLSGEGTMEDVERLPDNMKPDVIFNSVDDIR